MTCPVCGNELRPLLTSWYCPRDCDRVPVVTDDSETSPIMRFDLQRDQCTTCGSSQVDPFLVGGSWLRHCWDCGAVLP